MMRNRDAWLAAIAAAMGISEEACRRDAAPQAQQVVSAAASSSVMVAATAPSASADTTPSATASASAIASAAPSASTSTTTIAKPSASDAAKLRELSQAICGAVPQNVFNGSCGVSNSRPGTIGSGGIGSLNTIGHSNACGAPGNVPFSSTSNATRAEVALIVGGGAAGDDHVATNLRPRFRACANQALRQDPSQQGKLVITVKIGANGEVASADVASNQGLSPASAQCMVRMVKNAQFAAGAARTLTIAIAQTKQSP